jgi:hypothetical protein
VLLYSQGIEVSTRQAVRWTMGIFFDLAVPSSNGGDLVKAGYVAKYVGAGRRARAVMAVAFDRMLGLMVLFLLAFLVRVLGWECGETFPLAIWWRELHSGPVCEGSARYFQLQGSLSRHLLKTIFDAQLPGVPR